MCLGNVMLTGNPSDMVLVAMEAKFRVAVKQDLLAGMSQ
jgi:hypothetical protein